jgi:hypothetical protein
MRESPYLNAREAIAYLRLGSRRALQRLIDEWALPYHRRGRILLFDVRELDTWVHRQGASLEQLHGRRTA